MDVSVHSSFKLAFGVEHVKVVVPDELVVA